MISADPAGVLPMCSDCNLSRWWPYGPERRIMRQGAVCRISVPFFHHFSCPLLLRPAGSFRRAASGSASATGSWLRATIIGPSCTAVARTTCDNEFFVEERTVANALADQNAYLGELIRSRASRGELRRLYPGFDWR